MDKIQLTLDKILLEITDINNNISISNSYDDINKLYKKIKLYDNDLEKINTTINIIPNNNNFQFFA